MGGSQRTKLAHKIDCFEGAVGRLRANKFWLPGGASGRHCLRRGFQSKSNITLVSQRGQRTGNVICHPITVVAECTCESLKGTAFVTCGPFVADPWTNPDSSHGISVDGFRFL